MPGGKQSLLASGQPWLSAKGGERYIGLFPFPGTHMDAGPAEGPQEAGISDPKLRPLVIDPARNSNQVFQAGRKVGVFTAPFF